MLQTEGNRLTEIRPGKRPLSEGDGGSDGGGMYVRAYNTRLERRADLSRLQFLPVDAAEERMLSDGSVRTRRHSETRRRMTIQQLQQPNSPLKPWLHVQFVACNLLHATGCMQQIARNKLHAIVLGSRRGYRCQRW